MIPGDWFVNMVEREALQVMREDLSIFSQDAKRRALYRCANRRGYDIGKAKWIYAKGLEYRGETWQSAKCIADAM